MRLSPAVPPAVRGAASAQEPAVHLEHVPVDVRGPGRAQEDDRPGHFLRESEPPHRNRLRELRRAASLTWAIMGVSMTPGATALTRIPRLAHSRASTRVRACTPAFAAA